jgi:hypothetical protein
MAVRNGKKSGEIHLDDAISYRPLFPKHEVRLMSDLQGILRELDTLMSQRATKDEVTKLIVEALHRINDKINEPTLKVSPSPSAGSAVGIIK